MISNSKFAPPNEQDVTRLVESHPFAWVVTAHEGEMLATPLPLRPVLDADGKVVELLGHFARSNTHVELLRRARRALVLFMGPHGYISSSWLEDRSRTPTWNYAAAQFVVDVEFIEDCAPTDAVIRDMVGAMEAGRPRPWSIDEMGVRYERMVSGIIAFRARVVDRRVKFKLGQDERDSEYRDIVVALRASGAAELLEWMQRCNPDRPAS